MALPTTLPTDRWTLVHALKEAARSHPASRLVFPGSGPVSFAEIDQRSDQVATGLDELGVEPGDRIAVIAKNSLEFLLTVLAAHKRRAVAVPLNIELKGTLLAHQLRTSSPRLLVIDADLVGSVESIPPDVRTYSGMVIIGSGDERAADGSGSVPFDEIASSRAQAGSILTATPRDSAAILFTSGTTGPAKGVVMPHAHCFLFGALQAQATATSAEDTVFVALPMFHVNALFMALGSCLITGANANVIRRFSASSWLDELRSSGATVTNMVGVMAQFVHGQPPTDEDQNHRLRRALAIPVSETWAPEFESRFGMRFVRVYGMTECNIVSFGEPTADLPAGCTGPIVDEFFDVRIVSADTGQELPAGTTGEIVVRPRLPSCFMAGYFGADDQTVSAWRDLWFHTGDAGRLDDQQRLYFVDRLKDCIRRRGENISAFEVEQVINQHEGVLESAAVGIITPDSGGDEEIKLCVVVSDDTLRERDLHDWAVAELPRYAVPRFIEIVPELQKTATGKLRKDVLRTVGVTTHTVDCLEPVAS
jgi:carnitine-CoA ligase